MILQIFTYKMSQEKEALSENAPSGPIFPENQGILIGDVKYSYSITKSESNEESLIIKLIDPSQKSNIYFTYEAPMEQLIKEIKFLSLCESLDEMIESLQDVFSQGNVFVEEKDGVYNMEFKVSGIKKKCIIQLTKNEIEQPKEPENEIESKINKLEKNYKDLYNKYEELKIIKKNEVKEIVKEVIFDDDIALKFFEKMKPMILSIINDNNKNEDEDENDNENIENNIMNKVKEELNNKENKINNQINIFQQQLNENINDINNIKSNNNNYIILQVKIDEKDLNKDIRLFNRVKSEDYYNFEGKDIEAIVDKQIVNIKSENNKFCWNFKTKGIHSIKILFKKKLLQCDHLFSNCDNIYKIDCSNFDCSQIIDCSYMFFKCSSLIEINFGKLDFAFSNNFSYMFEGCSNLEKIDVSYFNTNNSKTFEGMFWLCSKLKEINVSKFKTTNCKDINRMFFKCSSLESIDMFHWDMKNINNIYYLFRECSKLKNIRINFNNNKKLSFYEIFYGLPEGGSFVWKKGTNCNELLKLLPASWNKTQE